MLCLIFENFGTLPPLFYLGPVINKRFDRIAKELADEAPMLFLRLLGMIPPGADVSLEPLRPETAPQVVMQTPIITRTSWRRFGIMTYLLKSPPHGKSCSHIIL